MSFMPSTPTLSSQLPTFDIVGASPPEPVAAEDAARAWIGLFTACAVAGDTERLIHEALYTDPWWRDLFALTWDIRTFHGRAAISHFLHDRLAVTRFGGIELLKATYQTPYPALCWIVAAFSFKTDVAQGRGEARLVYCADRTWRAVAVYTNLEGVKDFPECLGPHRDFRPNHGRCPVGAVYSRSPDVLIIGGGQSGLAVAARLNALGVPNLVVEADERVGDRWRKRHEKLCLHGPIWQNHMPYLPFPSTWPVFTPAHKFASWLEFYADALDISVQTATSATSLHRNSDTQKWDVVLQSPNGVQNLLSVKHVVVAAGWPFKRVSLPGQDDFIGQVIHSTDFSSAEPYVGKKVVVIGACSSGTTFSEIVESRFDAWLSSRRRVRLRRPRHRRDDAPAFAYFRHVDRPRHVASDVLCRMGERAHGRHRPHEIRAACAPSEASRETNRGDDQRRRSKCSKVSTGRATEPRWVKKTKAHFPTCSVVVGIISILYRPRRMPTDHRRQDQDQVGRRRGASDLHRRALQRRHRARCGCHRRGYWTRRRASSPPRPSRREPRAQADPAHLGLRRRNGRGTRRVPRSRACATRRMARPREPGVGQVVLEACRAADQGEARGGVRRAVWGVIRCWCLLVQILPNILLRARAFRPVQRQSYTCMQFASPRHRVQRQRVALAAGPTLKSIDTPLLSVPVAAPMPYIPCNVLDPSLHGLQR